MDPTTGAIVPSDIRVGTPKEALQLLTVGNRDLRPRFKKLEEKAQMLVIFDSCFSGESVKSMGSLEAQESRYVSLSDLTRNQVSRESLLTAERSLSTRSRASEYPYRNVVYLSAAAKKVSRIQVPPGGAAAEWERTVEYTAPNFAQTMQSRMMTIKPVTAPFNIPPLVEPHRTHSVLLQPQVQAETVRVVTPAGFEVDELPDALKLETFYGTYMASYAVEPGVVVVKRSLEIRASTVPAALYGELRTFVNRVLGSVQAPIVFAKRAQ